MNLGADRHLVLVKTATKKGLKCATAYIDLGETRQLIRNQTEVLGVGVALATGK